MQLSTMQSAIKLQIQIITKNKKAESIKTTNGKSEKASLNKSVFSPTGRPIGKAQFLIGQGGISLTVASQPRRPYPLLPRTKLWIMAA